MKTAYIVGGGTLEARIFQDRGFKPLFDKDVLGKNVIPDVLVFTGGADLSPSLYGEENISSHPNPIRDEFEVSVYKKFITEDGKGPAVAGICRGGQLINVMSGGKMVQHIDNHGSRNHPINTVDGEPLGEINSCHHQEMILPSAGRLLATAPDGTVEIAFFEKSRAFAFQAHPEWGHENTTKVFFDMFFACLPDLKEAA